MLVNKVSLQILLWEKLFGKKKLRRRIARINLYSCLHPSPSMISTKGD
jgi:hypothetical protein